jgi:hypothetical protein
VVSLGFLIAYLFAQRAFKLVTYLIFNVALLYLKLVEVAAEDPLCCSESEVNYLSVFVGRQIE